MSDPHPRFLVKRRWHLQSCKIILDAVCDTWTSTYITYQNNYISFVCYVSIIVEVCSKFSASLLYIGVGVGDAFRPMCNLPGATHDKCQRILKDRWNLLYFWISLPSFGICLVKFCLSLGLAAIMRWWRLGGASLVAEPLRRRSRDIEAPGLPTICLTWVKADLLRLLHHCTTDSAASPSWRYTWFEDIASLPHPLQHLTLDIEMFYFGHGTWCWCVPGWWLPIPQGWWDNLSIFSARQTRSTIRALCRFIWWW